MKFACVFGASQDKHFYAELEFLRLSFINCVKVVTYERIAYTDIS